MVYHPLKQTKYYNFDTMSESIFILYKEAQIEFKEAGSIFVLANELLESGMQILGGTGYVNMH